MRRLVCLLTLLTLSAVPAEAANVTIGKGKGAHVLVDAAGTAHIVWSTPAASGSDEVHYCRLKRAATTCDKALTLDTGATKTQERKLLGGPVIYTIGDALVVLDSRIAFDGYPGPQGTTNTPILAWVSTDGGDSFSTDPGVVGAGFDVSNPSIDIGTEDNPTRAFIDDQSPQGPAAFVHTIEGGSYTAEGTGAKLSEDKGHAGGLTLDGTQPVALINDYFATNRAGFRRWTGSGDINDASTWGAPVQLPGDGRLVGGPDGLLLFDRDSAGDVVHKITGSTVGAAHVVSDVPTEPIFNRLVQTGSGKAIAAYIKEGDGTLYAKESGDGLSWPAKATTLLSKDAKYFDAAAADDGGGVAVTEVNHGNVQTDPIVVSSFGTQTPTGKPGLGGLGGGGTSGGGGGGSDDTGTCTVSYDAVEVRAANGTCLLPATGKYKGYRVSNGAVDLNGLTLTPDSGERIYVSKSKKRLFSSGPVTVTAEHGTDVNPVRLYHGKLDVTGHSAVGAELFDFPGAGVTVEGFPVDGHVPVVLRAGHKIDIPLTLSLPAGFRDSATITLSTGSQAGLSLPSLTIGPFSAGFGVIGFQDITLKYSGGASDMWTGSGEVLIPQDGGFTLSASVTFKDNHFIGGTLSTKLPFPGVPVVAGAVYLTGVSFSLATEPSFALGGNATFGAIPFGDIYSVGVVGGLQFSTDPVRLVFTGTGQIFTIPVANALVGYDATQGFTAAMKADVSIPGIDVGADASIGVGKPHGTWRFSGSAKVTASALGAGPATLADVAFDDHGFGVCIGTSPLAVTIGEVWKTGPSADFGCNVGDFTNQGTARSARQGAFSTFTVPAGAAGYDVRAIGTASHAPDVHIEGPDGSVVNARHAAFESTQTEVLGLANPPAGTYSVVPNPGSVDLSEVDAAQVYGSPHATATVSGHGYKRRLHVKVANPDSHLAVRVAERLSTGALVPIGDFTGKGGSKRFTPALGGAGGRALIAEIAPLGGHIDSSAIAGKYTAPGPPRPGRVRRLHARHRGATVSVSFRGAKHAIAYLVEAHVRHGGTVLKTTSGHKVTLPAIDPRGRGTVTVRPIGQLTRRGPVSSKRFR